MPRTMKRKAPPDPPAPLPAEPATVIMQPTNIAEARELGLAVVGTPITAPLAPKEGAIPGKSGDFVTTVLKNFWESPTIQKLRNAVGLAILLALGVIAVDVIEANGDVKKIDWNVTSNAAIAAGAFSLASGYAAWLKKRDNDPVK